MNQKGPSNRKKGRSKKPNVLSAAVKKATENFILRGEEIAVANPEVEMDMIAAIDEVRATGWYSSVFIVFLCVISLAVEVQWGFSMQHSWHPDLVLH